MYFVSGITGNVGGATARYLLQAGKQVRALVRNRDKAAAWADQGVEIVQGDFKDAEHLAAALQNVEGAFLMVPPNMAPEPGLPEAAAVVASIGKAVQRANPPRIVALSSIGSEQTSRLGLITATHWLEQALAAGTVPTAFVRAGGFLENNLGSLPGVGATGVFYSMYQPLDRPVPHIATDDIGRQVADLLTGDWQGRRIIELGTAVTPAEIGQAIGKALGREVTAQAVPRDRWSGVLQSFGLPQGRTGAFEEMVDSFNSGWIHFGVDGTEAVPATITPEDFYRQAAKR